MADNVQLNPMIDGSLVATDDISGVHYQRIKLIIGADGVNDGDISAANPLPVDSELTTADLDAGAGTDTKAVVGLALKSFGGATYAEDDTGYGDGIGNSILSVALRLYNGASYDRLRGDTTGVNTQGNVAHDAADAGNPVKIGAKAVDLGANPTAVAASDRTNLLASRAGQLFTIGGHPNILSQNLQITDADGAQTDTAIITAAANVAIVVTAIEVTADNGNSVDVSVRIGFGTANTPAADAAKVLLFHPGIAAGSGVIKGNGGGIIGIGASDEDLRLTCEDPVNGSVSITVTYYTVAIG